MATLYDNLQGGTITNNPLTSGGTTLNSAALANLVAVTGADVLYITLDPDGTNGAPEIVKVTAHTASATSATIVRAQQGTTARSHPLSSKWLHGITESDLQSFLTSVSTANIVDANVTTAKIADSNVTTAKIADANVTTAKIADLNVTQGKLATALQTDTLFKADNKTTWTSNVQFGGSATNLTVNYAKYQYVTANRVHGEIDVSLTGTPGTGNFTFTLPVAMANRPSGGVTLIGLGTASGGGNTYMIPILGTAGSTAGLAAASPSLLSAQWTNTNPLTLGNLMFFNLKFEYPVS